jgi:cholesterol transport system auxiliary component
MTAQGHPHAPPHRRDCNDCDFARRLRPRAEEGTHLAVRPGGARAGRPAWPSVAWQLQIPRPHASELLDSPRIVVRPSDGELQVYTVPSGAEPAPDIVQDAVLHAFEDSGRSAASAVAAAAWRATTSCCSTSVASSPITPAAARRTRRSRSVAKLVANRSNIVIATRTCGSASRRRDAVGESLARVRTALTDVVQELVGWTLVEGQKYDAANPRPPHASNQVAPCTMRAARSLRASIGFSTKVP